MPRSRSRFATFAPAWILAPVLLLGCARPIDRPLEGAPPARAAEQAPKNVGAAPPTSVVAQPEPTASPAAVAAVVVSPSPQAAAGPSPSPQAAAAPSPTPPGRNPILGSLQPAPGAVVPPGTVQIGARITASADLTEVVLTLNGVAVQPRVTQQDDHTWLIVHASGLPAGSHRAHLLARDQHGRAGGFGWQFEVAGSPRASPAALSPAR